MKRSVEDLNKNDIKLGDKVWFCENIWSARIVYGIIEDIKDEYILVHGKSYDNNSFTGKLHKMFNDVFKTKEQCLQAIKTKNDLIIAAYKEEITDIKSLINFPLEHNVGQCEEYTDYETIRAYKERAAELGFNIDLENSIERD